MTKVGSRELKNRLGTYLGLVRQGKALLVTHRGMPVAVLAPFAPPSSNDEARLQRLAAEGELVTPPTGALPIEAEKPPLPAGVGLSEAIIEDREDRF